MKILRFTTVLRILLGVYAIVGVSSCRKPEQPRDIVVSSVSVSPASVSLTVGATQQLSVTVLPADATDKSEVWKSSAPAVASVTASGLVTALAEGSASITVTVGGKSASCSVSVIRQVISVESVTLDKTELQLTEGEKATLVATILPENADNKEEEWKSSAPDVASVNASGEVTALAEGSATITVKVDGKDASCSVLVKRKVIAVESVTLDKTELELTEGDEAMLVATILPENADNKKISWKSANSGIASVEEGKVTAIKAGATTITVTTEDGEHTASCAVTVKEKPKASSITLDAESVLVSAGESYTLSVIISPADAVCDFQWATSDSRIATVKTDGNKGIIETKDFGTATITVTESRSGLTASVVVSTRVSGFAWKVESEETYEGHPLIVLEREQIFQLLFSCEPSSATRLFADFSQWEIIENEKPVEKPACISIDADGIVTALKNGLVRLSPKDRISAREGDGVLYIQVKAGSLDSDGDNEDIGFEDWD